MSNSYPSSSKSSLSNPAKNPAYHDDINHAYNEEWQKLLARSRDLQDLKTLPFFLNLSSSFDTISKLCHQMNISTEAEFTALDCLESMIESFLYELTEAIKKDSNGDPEKINTYWSDSYKVFEGDVPLIIFLILSIAAKYTDAKTQFDLPLVRELAQRVTGKEYELSEIKDHKFNLFKTMGFTVLRPAALHSMEQLMKMVYDKRFLRVSLEEFLSVGVLALRYSYLDKNRIYESLADVIGDPVKFKKCTGDKVLLASAVVYASKNDF